jgi:hypothetical protein
MRFFLRERIVGAQIGNLAVIGVGLLDGKVREEAVVFSTFQVE